MNWLAHVFLSEQDVEFRLGNLLADIVKGDQRASMTATFLRGVQRHHAIDSFTDSHPVVRRSRSRIDAGNRRFSGVLVDVFYDFFLASNWDRYASMPLDSFTSAFYADVRAHPLPLPEQAQITIDRIVEYDLLGSYCRIEGVERSLQRLSMRLAKRWRREFALENGVADLVAHHDAFAEDFAEFFPALRTHLCAAVPA
ncbi:MAG: ACP phosphodiesterase [Steroidobacter sp.]